MGDSSLICRISGTLFIERLEIKRKKFTVTILGKPSKPTDNEEKLIAEESYFSIHTGNDNFALLPTLDYFVSGISSFQELSGTVIDTMEIPVNALIRVYSAQTSFNQMIAVPLVILEP